MKGLGKQKKLEKKYKDILSYKDLIKSVDEFEQKLKTIKEHTKAFDNEIRVLKEKEQEKETEF